MKFEILFWVGEICLGLEKCSDVYPSETLDFRFSLRRQLTYFESVEFEFLFLVARLGFTETWRQTKNAQQCFHARNTRRYSAVSVRTTR